MPYIVTVRHPERTVWEGPRSRVVTEAPPTRTAVATLNEARDAVATDLEGSPAWIGTTYPFNDLPRLTAQAESLPESGGTIGPLPDGTVIEVRPTP